MGAASSQTLWLAKRAAAGDNSAWRQLFAVHRERLHRMVRLRLDHRARARIDPSDVLQEAYLEAFRSLPTYLAAPTPRAPFFLWLRAITCHKLMSMLRYELGAEMRDPRREVSIHDPCLPQTTSGFLAEHLAARISGPLTAVMRREMKSRLQEALDQLEPLDREVLMLRHFEQLTNAETAQILKIEPSASSKRYVRALKRLGSVLAPNCEASREQ